MARVPRSDFIDAVSQLAAEVWDFHSRWGVEDRLPESPFQRMKVRKSLLVEEMKELEAEFDTHDESALAEEAADVAFVAIGHLAALEDLGVKSARVVASKNAAKTDETHYINNQTGKITRRGRRG